MPQLHATICNHEGNIVPPGVQQRCRKCGTILVLSSRAVANGAFPTPDSAPDMAVNCGGLGINAAYPGDFSPSSLAATARL